MHPAIIQAVAAERCRDLHAGVAASRRAGEIRRTRRQRPIIGVRQALALRVALRVARPRRDPRPA